MPSCAFRFEAVVFTSPDAGATFGPSTQLLVAAKLTFAAGAPTDFLPGALALTLPGGAVGPPSLSLAPDGSYGPSTVDVSNVTPSGAYVVAARFDAPDASAVGIQSFNVDRDGPQLELKVQVPPMRPAQWAAGGWRRDDEPLVLLAASEDLAGTSMLLAGSDAGVLKLGDLTACSDAGLVPSAGVCTSMNCACYQLDLAVPPLSALAGQFVLSASAADKVNNANAAVPQPVAVTRQRWQLNTAAGVGFPKAAAAIDSRGNIYVGASTGLRGFTAAGDDAGFFGTTAPVEASPAVAVLADGGQYLVFGSTGALGGMNSFNLTNGALGTGGLNCAASATGNGVVSGVALTTLINGGVPRVAAIGVINDSISSALVAYLPEANGCLSQSNANVTDVSIDSPANIVVRGKLAFLPTSTGANVRAYSWIDNSNWTALNMPEPGFPVSLAGSGNFNGLALVDSGMRIAGGGGGGAGIGQLFQLPTVGGDGGTDWRFPLSNTAPVGAPSAWNSGEIVFGVDGTPKTVKRVGQAGAALVDSATADGGVLDTAGFVSTAPVLGEGDLVYAVSRGGVLNVLNRAMAQQWSASGYGLVTGSPTLDCNRSRKGGPGILYISSTNGNLYSILVDSPNLSASAEWPKYQHDAQNTGNPAMPLNAGCP